MVWTGRIPGRRPDSAVLLGDELFGAERLVGGIAPVLLPDFRVQPLRQRFGQAVRDGFDENRLEIIPLFGALCGPGFGAVDGDGEGTDVVVCRSDEVGQAELDTGMLRHLLAQEFKMHGRRSRVARDRDGLRPGARGGKQAHHGTELKPLRTRRPGEHRLGFVVQPARLGPYDLVVEDARKLPRQAP